MELWDAYDGKGNPLGFDLVRGEPIPPGCCHVVAEIAVRHADGSWLLTQRDWGKPNHPGKWEMGAGGSVLKGESWPDGARRELREETGIQTDALEPIFTLFQPEKHLIYAGYLCRYAGDKEAVILQPGETIGWRWLATRELKAFAASPECIIGQRRRWQDYLKQI